MKTTPLFDKLKWTNHFNYHWDGRCKFNSLEVVVTAGKYVAGFLVSNPSVFLNDYRNYESYQLSVFLPNGTLASDLFFDIEYDDDAGVHAANHHRVTGNLKPQQIEEVLEKVQEVANTYSLKEIKSMLDPYSEKIRNRVIKRQKELEKK